MSAHPSHVWTASWKPNSDVLVSHCGKCACLLSSIEANTICPCAPQLATNGSDLFYIFEIYIYYK